MLAIIPPDQNFSKNLRTSDLSFVGRISREWSGEKRSGGKEKGGEVGDDGGGRRSRRRRRRVGKRGGEWYLAGSDPRTVSNITVSNTIAIKR